MMKLAYAITAVALVALPGAAYADSTGSYGDVAVVATGPASNPIVFELTSNTSGAGYAGIYHEFTTPLLLSDITTLSADYQMTVGTFGGGAPRFTFFGAGGSAYVYWGAPQPGGTFTDPNAGAWASTGNYADLGSSDLRVGVNGFGGVSANYPYISWADFVAAAGTTQIDFITIDLDGGTFTNLPDGQRMLVDNFAVNGSVLSAVPEPASWALMILGFGLIGGLARSQRIRQVKLAA